MGFDICAKFLLGRKMRVVQMYELQKALSEQHQEDDAGGWSLEVLCSGGSVSQVVLVTPQRCSPCWDFQHWWLLRLLQRLHSSYSILLGMGGFSQSPLEVVPWLPARTCGAQIKSGPVSQQCWRCRWSLGSPVLALTVPHCIWNTGLDLEN